MLPDKVDGKDADNRCAKVDDLHLSLLLPDADSPARYMTGVNTPL